MQGVRTNARSPSIGRRFRYGMRVEGWGRGYYLHLGPDPLLKLPAVRDVRDVEGLGLVAVGAREAAAARDPHNERARVAREQRLGGHRARVGREEVARDGRERPLPRRRAAGRGGGGAVAVAAVRADVVVAERRDGGLDVVLPPGECAMMWRGGA